MEEQRLETCDAGSLLGLLKVAAPGQEAGAPWRPEELGAVLRHQLAAPLEAELATLAPGREARVTRLTAGGAGGAPVRSFADLISRPAPPAELVVCLKDYARAACDDGSLPTEVATLLYFTAIALAAVRCGERITGLDDAALRAGLEWAVGLHWGDDAIRAVLREHLCRLAPAPGRHD